MKGKGFLTFEDLPGICREIEKQSPTPPEQWPYNCPACNAKKRTPSEACLECGSDAGDEFAP